MVFSSRKWLATWRTVVRINCGEVFEAPSTHSVTAGSFQTPHTSSKKETLPPSCELGGAPGCSAFQSFASEFSRVDVVLCEVSKVQATGHSGNPLSGAAERPGFLTFLGPGKGKHWVRGWATRILVPVLSVSCSDRGKMTSLWVCLPIYEIWVFHSALTERLRHAGDSPGTFSPSPRLYLRWPSMVSEHPAHFTGWEPLFHAHS